MDLLKADRNMALKPRARPIRLPVPGGPDFHGWRITYPDSKTGYVGRTITSALGVAHRCRLAYMCRRRYEQE